ncbi:MAG: hypothetical protein IH994_00315 [Proteobacteria bacterium]|nr:hypothetical protein [Pseudomonadota bacterium]
MTKRTKVEHWSVRGVCQGGGNDKTESPLTARQRTIAAPSRTAAFAFDNAGGGLEGVDFVAFYDKPFLKFERLLETYLAFAPKGFQSFNMAMPA